MPPLGASRPPAGAPRPAEIARNRAASSLKEVEQIAQAACLCSRQNAQPLDWITGAIHPHRAVAEPRRAASVPAVRRDENQASAGTIEGRDAETIHFRRGLEFAHAVRTQHMRE